LTVIGRSPQPTSIVKRRLSALLTLQSRTVVNDGN
jgi:hypothetical protein